MLEALDNIKQYGGITLIIISLMAIFASGLFFGIAYYVMDVTETSFKANDFPIHNNVFFDNSQQLWDLSVYPFLALRELLVWFSFFFIFALVLGMLVVGYQSGKSPVLMGVLVVFIIALTYGALEISNIYRSLLEISLIRDMMIPFTVYNKVMLNFPWFTFFIGLMSVMLSMVNYQRTHVNAATTREELNY